MSDAIQEKKGGKKKDVFAEDDCVDILLQAVYTYNKRSFLLLLTSLFGFALLVQYFLGFSVDLYANFLYTMNFFLFSGKNFWSDDVF